jgi:GTP-binding protein HflX
LEEVTAAQLVVHVRDIAHPETAEQAQDVNTILETLGLDRDVPLIEMWNKSDSLDSNALDAFQNAAERSENIHLTSALTGDGVPEFLEAVSKRLTPDKTQSELVLKFDQGRARAWLFEQGLVSQEQQTQEGFCLTISWTARQKKAFSDQFGPKSVSES